MIYLNNNNLKYIVKITKLMTYELVKFSLRKDMWFLFENAFKVYLLILVEQILIILWMVSKKIIFMVYSR
jgi:hypothetical protein